jgi:catecholate siderophore receptor
MKKPRNLTPIALALLGLCAVPARAQEPATPASTLPQITVHDAADSGYGPGPVSISRLPKDPLEIPQSITVITRDLMQSQGATSLASALRNVPGLTIGAAEGGQIGTNINLNGFSARTDVYLDGMRDRGQYYRDLFALDRVEVLMGPSSMLFGRGSTGGVVNQVTKKPQPTAFADVGASVTSNGLVRSTVDMNQPLSETSAFRVAAMGQQGDASDRQQSTVKDFGLAPSLMLGMGTPTQITLSALLQHNNDMADYGLPPLNGAPAPVDRKTAYGFTDDRTKSDVGFLGATVVHKLTPTTTLRNQTQYNSVSTDAIETAPQSIGTRTAAGVFTPLAAGAATPPLDQLWVRQQSHDRDIHDTSLFNQTELTTRLDAGGIQHSLLAGLELGTERYRNQAYFRNGSCGSVALNPAGGTSGYVSCTPLVDPPQVSSPDVPRTAGNRATGSADTVAAYFNDDVTLAQRWKLVGGARYDHYSAKIANSVSSATTPASAEQTVGFTSVRLGAIYQPTPQQSLYVSYSTSFNPSLEQLVNTTGGTEPLPPERNRSYEVGGKWDLLAGDLSATGAVFRITKYNARSQNTDGSYSATGTVQVDGARAGLSGRVTKKMQVFAAYTYLDAEIVDAIAAGTQGRVPANTPRNAASLWSTYAFTPEWELGGGVTYVGSRYANNTDTVRVGSYARWDALVAYHQPKYDVRLNLFNLANRRYYDALIPSDGGRAVPGIGRTAMLSVDYRF